LLSRHAYAPAGLTWAASIVLHGVFVAGIGWLAFHTLEERAKTVLVSPPPSELAIEIELPVLSEGALLADVEKDPVGEPPRPMGGTTVPRIDTGAAGHGGNGKTKTPAIHLDDRDEDVRLSPDLLTRLDRDQQQRLKTASDRASWEDRRATTNPMELTFLATGTGHHAERREPSPADPSRGAQRAAGASRTGGDLGARDSALLVTAGDAAARREPGASHNGSLIASPGAGVNTAPAGADHRTSADVALGRPMVTTGSVTVPASARSRPHDDVDTDQEVATKVQSLVQASTAGGVFGDGVGGTSGGGDPGAGGGPNAGSHPRPLGPGDGDWFDLETNDPRLVDYFRKIHKKVDPLWANAFPKSAMLELKQGMVILEFTIDPDGTAHVLWPPVRPSGIDEFDRNCADALRRAKNFGPLPAALGRTPLRVRAPFVAMNPIVK
jgi:TonB family protein